MRIPAYAKVSDSREGCIRSGGAGISMAALASKSGGASLAPAGGGRGCSRTAGCEKSQATATTSGKRLWTRACMGNQ